MKLFEYQAKQVFADHGIPVPRSLLLNEGEFNDPGPVVGYPMVLKSQVLMGGRGKAGLIESRKTPPEAAVAADDLYQSPYDVRRILAEEAIDIASEIYLSVTWDPPAASALIIACAEGGVEIEESAGTAPEKLIRENVEVSRGMMPFQARDVAYRLGLKGDTAGRIVTIILKLYEIFQVCDGELVEINPLFVTASGDVVAGDGKLIVDDAALAKHPEYTPGREHYQSDADFEAARDGIPYLQFDGNISLMCAGAGLANAVFDMVHDEGGRVANYLEFGGPNYRRAKRAMELCLKNDAAVILAVTFGTIARADVMAQGIVEAMEELTPRIPIITCIRGTNEEEAVKILKKAGLDPLFDTEEAVRRAVAAAGGGKMSIFIDQTTRVLVQGITGKEGASGLNT